MGKTHIFAFAMALTILFGAASASDGVSRVAGAVSNLCISLTSILPVVSMLMVVVAGLIYAAGQIMGAETRARANVWATAALTGPLIGLLIYAIAPPLFSMIYGIDGSVSCFPQ